MPELRQDPTTREWIIIATERKERPHDFRRSKPKNPGPEYEHSCPFCPGNENRTPPEVLLHGGLRRLSRRGAAGECSQPASLSGFRPVRIPCCV
jgi:galactose-1-phosphate uridylyltransferase